jgi:hypothetical protein
VVEEIAPIWKIASISPRCRSRKPGRSSGGRFPLGDIAPFVVAAQPVADHEIGRAAGLERRDQVGADEAGAAGNHDHGQGNMGGMAGSLVFAAGRAAWLGVRLYRRRPSPLQCAVHGAIVALSFQRPRSRIMQIDNKLFDDLARMAAGAAGTAIGVRDEIEAQVRQQAERLLSRMDLVTRDEFEAVREMASRRPWPPAWTRWNSAWPKRKARRGRPSRRARRATRRKARKPGPLVRAFSQNSWFGHRASDNFCCLQGGVVTAFPVGSSQPSVNYHISHEGRKSDGRPSLVPSGPIRARRLGRPRT